MNLARIRKNAVVGSILERGVKPKYSISGNVGVTGVTVALGSLSTTSSDDGNYTLSNIPITTAGTLTLTKSSYAFYPARKRIRKMVANLTNQNFTATQLTATYYVRKTGNDTTGNGSDALPWLTVSKALSSIPIGGQSTIKVGAGTYTENWGLVFNKVYTNLVVVEPESGVLGDAIFNNSSSTYSGFIVLGYKNLRLNKIAITQGTSTRACVWMQGNTSYIDFIDCSFAIDTTSVASSWGPIYIQPASGETISNIIFDGCSFTVTGTKTVGFFIKALPTNTIVSNVTITHCTFTDAGNKVGVCIGLNSPITSGAGVDSVEISNSTITSGGASFVISLGEDLMSSPGPITNTKIYDCTFAGINHVVAVEFGTNGTTIDNCNVTGNGSYAMVIKESQNTEISNCNVTAGSNSGIYFKAVTAANAHQNIIHSSAGAGFRLAKDNTQGNKCLNWRFTNNLIVSTGSSMVVVIGNSTDDAGGGVCDYNIYQWSGSPSFGLARDVTFTNLSELRGAWASYGDGSNDSHSM